MFLKADLDDAVFFDEADDTAFLTRVAQASTAKPKSGKSAGRAAGRQLPRQDLGTVPIQGVAVMHGYASTPGSPASRL